MKQKILNIVALIAIVASLTAGFTPSAFAGPGDRLSLGFGIITLGKPSETDLEVSAEYEHRYSDVLGYGGFLSYIFASKGGVTLVGLPEGFLHPLGGDWIVYGTPLAEMGSITGTNFGARFGTRVPIPLEALVLVPEVAVDFINGNSNLLIALGISF